jgi:hypothetical protein
MNYTDLCRINMYGMYSIIAKHIKGKEKLQEHGFVAFDLNGF